MAELYTANSTANYFSQPYSTYTRIQVNAPISSGDYAGQLRTNAFDNNPTTYWGSSQLGSANIVGTAYIGCSNLAHPVKKVRMYQGYASATTNYCTNFKFQYSNNGSTWIDIQAVTNGADKTWQEWVLPDYTPTGSTHSFRVLANGGFSGGASNNWIVDELQLYYEVVHDSEGAWQKSVTDYGVCGKFVYDSTNNTVRLPKITGFVEGASSTSNLGDLTQAGLPNITGTAYSGGQGIYTNCDGVFTLDSTFTKYINGGSTSGTASQMNLDASNCSSVYGNSNTVQPQSIKVLYYIVVANSTKTEIQVDIDEVATDLNGKADTDLSNVANTSGLRRLVKSGISGSAWYKIYSEYDYATGNYIGLWAECGDLYYAGSTTAGDHTIAFPFVADDYEFKDTNYVFIPSVIHNNNNGNSTTCYEKYTERTKTTAILHVIAAYFGYAWTACGYVELVS